MACPLFGAKPLYESLLIGPKINSPVSIVCKMVTILSGPQCIVYQDHSLGNGHQGDMPQFLYINGPYV